MLYLYAIMMWDAWNICGLCKNFYVSLIVAAAFCIHYMLLWCLGHLGRVGRVKNVQVFCVISNNLFKCVASENNGFACVIRFQNFGHWHRVLLLLSLCVWRKHLLHEARSAVSARCVCVNSICNLLHINIAFIIFINNIRYVIYLYV